MSRPTAGSKKSSSSSQFGVPDPHGASGQGILHRSDAARPWIRDGGDQSMLVGTRVIATPSGEPGEPFNAFFNPEVQTLAIRYQERTAESGPQTPSVARARRRTAAITHMTHQGSSDRTDITSPTNPKVDGTSISTPDASAHQPRA